MSLKSKKKKIKLNIWLQNQRSLPEFRVTKINITKVQKKAFN